MAASSIRSNPRRTALAIVAALIGAPAPAAAATSCVLDPRTGPVPDHVREARARFAEHTPAAAGGWEDKAERALQVRRDVAEGRLSRSQAGNATAVSGSLFVPVLLNLYAETNADGLPASADLQLALTGPSANPTMREYFEEVSYGHLNVETQVSAWERLPEGQLTYTGFSNGLGGTSPLFVIASLIEHDAAVDFGNFDNDGPDNIPNSGDDDGFVDILVVVHPQVGAECGANYPWNMWSHHTRLSSAGYGPIPTNDARHGGGVIFIDRYFVAPILSCEEDLIEMGVFCHELGHALGLPDLYDTSDSALYTGDSRGIGFWGVMGRGGWNTPSSPAHMTAFSKERLGWLDYLDVNQDLLNLCLPPVETNPTALRLWANGEYADEYFVVENRQPMGFDAMLPGLGLVIYHVNEDAYDLLRSSNKVNAFENAKAIDVECADAYVAGHVVDADHLDDETNDGDGGDPWCNGGGDVAFTPSSIPDSRAYSGASTGVSVRNIGFCFGSSGLPPGWVCADYIVGVSNPLDLCIVDCENDNCNQIATCDEWWATPSLWIRNADLGGGHDIPAPGIDNKLHIKYQNLGPDDASAVTITAYGAKGAMGLTWPDDAEFELGTVSTALLGANKSTTEQIVFPYPSELDLIGHYCIGVVIEHSQDPTLSNSAPLSNNLAQINSQVLVARAGDAARSVACPGSYHKDTRVYLHDGANPFGGQVRAEVRIGSPPNFDDAMIPATWNVSIMPGTGPFTLFPGMKDSIDVRATCASANHGEFAYVPLTLWDVGQDKAIGGIKLRFEVDCFAPRAPENGSAEWLPVSGDDLLGPTVLVQWDPVLLDTNGNPERTMRYDVYRKSENSPFEVLVDKKAIDAEPAVAGFQWYDTLPRDECATDYTYRVRAVDAAESESDPSEQIPLTCTSAVAALETESVEFEGARAFPNPFAAATTIRFRVPEDGTVDVAVYNARGERVRVLENGRRPAGSHEIAWDGRDDAGRVVASGVYFTRITGPGLTETKKLVLAR